MLSVLASQITAPQDSWLPVLVLLIIAIGFAVGNIVLSLLIGPKREGPGKAQAYESGMNPIGDAHKRFNVRFYVVAMIFLVFDVEIVFLYPWAAIYAPSVATPTNRGFGGMLLIEIGIFVAILLQMWFYLTPILYPVSYVESKEAELAADGNHLPLVRLFELNPMEHFVSAFRALLYDNAWPSAGDLGVCTLVAVVSLATGLWVFGRYEGRLAEEL